ncbi:MAG: fused MFS/spermidine synthase [Gemmatimonadetes bacterium]|nr:fused MFS/spermidine synthase [Gemmatimonadota bacterium]
MSSPVPPPRRPLPLLLLLFVGSGAAALIYEIVWFETLQLVIGATGISLGVLLGTFMGGMFLGSLLLPKVVPLRVHPLRVYAAIEAAIGVVAVLIHFTMPVVSRAYVSMVPLGLPSILLRALLSGLLLIPPTLLMGATLPAISRFVESTPEGVSWMGFFYGGNIAGAVVGSLAAGFWLLRVYDLAITTWVAVATDLLVAAVAYGLALRAPHVAADEADTTVMPIFPRDRRVMHVAIALSGLTALGAEVVWTRLLSLLLGGTTYTFSIILAVYLAALGVGSGVGSLVARVSRNPRAAFGVCQLGVVAGLAWSAYWITGALPHWPVSPLMAQENPVPLLQLDLVRALWAVFAAPLFWGASFPLAVAAVADAKQDPGRLVGGVYAANTIGSIVGSLAFALLLIPWIGTQDSQRVLMVLSAVSAAILLLPMRSAAATPGGTGRVFPRVGWSVAGIAGVAFLVNGIAPVPPLLVEYGRWAASYAPQNTLYVGEGRNFSAAVSDEGGGILDLHVGGKVVASMEPKDMRVQRMLGHMPALLSDHPRSVLVVGFGAGVTAGTFTRYPDIQRIVICEIEPLVIHETAPYFADVDYHVLNDPRVEVVYDDARHYLLTTHETFDVITADPIHPWMKGAAALYTEEYFQLARRHLAPGGVITQWVPLYESSSEVVKSELATFFAVFPEGTVWSNLDQGQGYDVILVAKPGGLSIQVDSLAASLTKPSRTAVASSLLDVGFNSTEDFLSTYTASAAGLGPWLQGAEINRDGNLRLMYLAGLRLNRYDQTSIYQEILSYQSVPPGLFRGSPGTVMMLREMMDSGGP